MAEMLNPPYTKISICSDSHSRDSYKHRNAVCGEKREAMALFMLILGMSALAVYLVICRGGWHRQWYTVNASITFEAATSRIWSHMINDSMGQTNLHSHKGKINEAHPPRHGVPERSPTSGNNSANDGLNDSVYNATEATSSNRTTADVVRQRNLSINNGTAEKGFSFDLYPLLRGLRWGSHPFEQSQVRERLVRGVAIAARVAVLRHSIESSSPVNIWFGWRSNTYKRHVEQMKKTHLTLTIVQTGGGNNSSETLYNMSVPSKELAKLPCSSAVWQGRCAAASYPLGVLESHGAVVDGRLRFTVDITPRR